MKYKKSTNIKILQEASNIWGCDGGRDIIRLNAGFHDLTIALWEDSDIYSKVEKSKKLFAIIKQIENHAEKAGFNARKIKEIVGKVPKDGFGKTTDLS